MPAPSRNPAYRRAKYAREMAASIEYEVQVEDFVRVGTFTKKFEPELRKAMRKRINQAAKPVVAAIRTEILNSPTSQSGESTGLRHGIARGIRTDLSDSPSSKRQGMFIRATSSKLPPSQKGMAAVYNLEEFRHPVYGDTEVWVDQAGHPYFRGPIYQRSTMLRTEIAAAIEDAAIAAGLALD